MRFVQHKDGSCDIVFSKEETKIILNKNKITLTAEGLRDFGNNLVKIVAEWNLNFNKDLQQKPTNGEEINIKK